MIEFLSCVLILASFEMINRKNRWGFIVMIVGQVFATVINIQSALYWLAIMHSVIVVMQIRGFIKWSKDDPPNQLI